jgi:hypothetical protein
VIVEFEVSKPFQVRPGLYRSNVTRFRVWWGWFAFAVLRGDGITRHRYVWEDQ